MLIRKPAFLHAGNIIVGRILASSIRVVDWPFPQPLSPLQGHRQSLKHLRGLQRFAQMIAHDLARPPVRDQSPDT